MANKYDEAFEKSIRDPEAFWAEAAEDCHWYKKWDKVLDDSNKPFYRWFTGGELNTCYNALDYHVDNGRGDQPARPVTEDIPVRRGDAFIPVGSLKAAVSTGCQRSQNSVSETPPAFPMSL